MNRQVSANVRFSVLEFFFWGAVISVEGFMVPYLTGAGFDERQAGVVMAAIYLVSVASTPVWGYLADRSGRHTNIISVAMIVSIGAVLAMWLSGTVFVLIVLFAFLYSLSAMSMPPLIDSWIMRLRRKGLPIKYEIVRGFGSFGFATTGAVLGIVLDRFGLYLLFPVFAGIATVVVLLVVTTRPPPGAEAPEAAAPFQKEPRDSPPRDSPAGDARAEAGAVHNGRPIREIMTNGRYVVLVLSIFLVFIGTRAAITFLPLRLYELGGTTVHVGWAQSLSSACEIPFMFLSLLVLRRFRPRAVIMLALALFCVRLSLNRFAPTPGLLVAVQLIKGPSFGFLLPATVHYIDRIASPRFRSLFQTLAPAIYFGLASVVGSSAGGLVAQRFGLETLFIAAASMAFVGTLLFALSLVQGRRVQQRPATVVGR